MNCKLDSFKMLLIVITFRYPLPSEGQVVVINCQSKTFRTCKAPIHLYCATKNVLLVVDSFLYM